MIDRSNRKAAKEARSAFKIGDQWRLVLAGMGSWTYSGHGIFHAARYYGALVVPREFVTQLHSDPGGSQLIFSLRNKDNCALPGILRAAAGISPMRRCVWRQIPLRGCSIPTDIHVHEEMMACGNRFRPLNANAHLK
jgi:hypothetical protein